MKHRIFVALPISEKIQKEILEWERITLPNLKVRWLEGKNLHITLIPPWYEDDLEKVKASLKPIENFGEIDLSFEKVAFGPDPRRPRLIWAEGAASQKLVDLHQKLLEVFDRKSEKSPFRLHLTIARFRPEIFSSFPIKKLDERVDWRDRVDRVVLFESRLSRQGADYQILSEAPL